MSELGDGGMSRQGTRRDRCGAIVIGPFHNAIAPCNSRLILNRSRNDGEGEAKYSGSLVI